MDNNTQSIEEFEKKEFKPKGAMAFFVAMLIVFILTWFSVYIIMLQRIN